MSNMKEGTLKLLRNHKVNTSVVVLALQVEFTSVNVTIKPRANRMVRVVGIRMSKYAVKLVY